MLDRIKNFLDFKFQLLKLKIKELKGRYYYRAIKLIKATARIACTTVVVVLTLKLLGII